MTKHTFPTNSQTAHQVRVSTLRRRHRVEVARWALASGQPLDRNALAIIVATREINPDGSICTEWTCESISALLTWRADAWCSTHRVRTSDALVDSLKVYLRYLGSNRLLVHGPDNLAELLDWVDEATEFPAVTDVRGFRSGLATPKRLTHPSSRAGEGLVHRIPKKSNMTARPS